MIEALAQWDRTLLLLVHQGWRCPAADAFFHWITHSRNFLVPLLLLWLGFLVLGGRKGRLVAVALLVTLLLTDLLSAQVLKPWIGRVRPCFAVEGVQALVPQPHSPSFPSSHAANTFGAAAVLAALRGRWWWLAFAPALAAGLSRVYLGVHYPSDALGGAALGAGLGVLASRAVVIAERRWRDARRAGLERARAGR